MCVSIDRIKATTDMIAKEYDVNSIYLFGSYARGDARDDSDIDMLVDADSLDFLSMSRMRQELAESLDTDVDMIYNGAVSDVFKFLIKDDQILIYEKSR